ncbi:hypothetical protein [Actinacidiphila sp. ITFR-21]|uniref:hypothetical protein n=1 Tax=Actinacidiphila sp. ITFR-21 TaxID=3075199 RepID=UPI00288B07E9|nr:hypothetical protein [Streptomyces sp. ITFR-21]WNI19920.1 hypothetical protein RLT57_30720 [Streptomyces sp. ITFR-21]
MEQLRPLADRVLADWSEHWDGENRIARLGADAHEAEDAIPKHLGLDDEQAFQFGETPGFTESDLVAQWDIDSAISGYEAEKYGITADTADERLDEIAAAITADLAALGTSGVAVVPGLDGYLRDLRDNLDAG